MCLHLDIIKLKYTSVQEAIKHSLTQEIPPSDCQHEAYILLSENLQTAILIV